MKKLVLSMLMLSVSVSALAEGSAFEKIKKMEKDRAATKAALTAALQAFTKQTEELVSQREAHMGVTVDLSDDIASIGDTLKKANLTKK